MAALAAVYVAAGRLGLAFAALHTSASPVWPPTGIALAALVLFGMRLWPAVFVGALLVNLQTSGEVLPSLGIAAGNTLEAIVGAYLVVRYANGRLAFERVQDVFKFCGSVLLFSTTISATIGVTTLAVDHSVPWDRFGAIWLTWWLGDAAGALIIAPPLIIWTAGPRPTQIRQYWAEAVLLAAAIVVVGEVVFSGWLPNWMIHYPLAFTCIPVLVWAAYRFEQAGAATSVAVLAASAIPGTLMGFGPFAVLSRNDALLLLQTFLATMTMTMIALAALVWDTRRGARERERLRAEAARLYRDAQAANRAKDEFLAILSHELRTPLNAVYGWVSVLRSGKLDRETTERALEAVERNTKVQVQLIDDLLDVSRITSGKLRLALRPVSLPDIVGTAVESMQALALTKSITLDLDREANLRVLGDAERLQQIVWNLVSNAIKFTPKGGRVTVRLSRSGPSARIVVRDTGIGIAPALVPFVFDRFRQGDGETTRGQGGLGLGLSIVRHLVDLHGGSVTAISDGEGRGATFIVTLPILEPASALASPASGVEGRRPGTALIRRLQGTRVLLVEDDMDARELLHTCLSQSGALVTGMPAAEPALELLELESFDLLVSDIGLPGDDGYALIRRIREREAGRAPLPAIAVSAYARADDRELALRAGFQLHLAKPIDPAAFLAAVTDLLATTGAPRSP
jgi:signal transduction histidine kinase/ActR/RegA family two-component response regulator